MSTVGAVIDRINRDFLQAPGEMPARFIIQNLSGSATTGVTGSSSDDVIASTAHGLSNGDKIVFTAMTGGTGLSTYTTYFVVGAATNTFQVALTAGGTALTFADFSAATYQEVADVASTDVRLVVNTDMLAPEEEDLLAAGTLLECESELILITAISGTTPSFTLTVRRGMYGTTAAAHTDGSEVVIAGEDYVPRKAIFDAVADSIEALWPDLWTVDVEETFATTWPIELPATVGQVLEIRSYLGSQWVVRGSWDELQDFPHSSTGVAVQVSGMSGALHVYYKKKPTRPTAEATTLASLGVESGWVKVIVYAAVAALIANRDLNQATIDFITQSLEAEAGGPIGSGADIRNALLQFQEFQLQPLKRQLAAKQFARVLVDDSY